MQEQALRFVGACAPAFVGWAEGLGLARGGKVWPGAPGPVGRPWEPAFGPAPFLLGGVGAAKGLLSCFLVPKARIRPRNQGAVLAQGGS